MVVWRKHLIQKFGSVRISQKNIVSDFENPWSPCRRRRRPHPHPVNRGGDGGDKGVRVDGPAEPLEPESEPKYSQIESLLSLYRHLCKFCTLKNYEKAFKSE